MILENEETSPVLSSLTAAVLSVCKSFFFSSIDLPFISTSPCIYVSAFHPQPTAFLFCVEIFPFVLQNVTQLNQAVTFSQIAYTILYVLPFYLSPTTRPSPTLSRDNPVVIRARIRFVSLSVIICSFSTIYVLSICAGASLVEALHLLGWYPVSILDLVKVLFLTSLLFAGPLFESGIVESGWRDWIQGHSLQDTLSSWIGFRNFVAVGLPILLLLFLLTPFPRAPSRRK